MSHDLPTPLRLVSDAEGVDDFGDRASSVWLLGCGVLAQDARFGGQRIYMLGAPCARFDNLRQLGFNNCASSAAVL